MHSKHIYTPIHRYCFGGATCVRLGGTDLVSSVIIAHPGTFTLDQVNAIKVPTSWICAEGVNLCNLIKQGLNKWQTMHSSRTNSVTNPKLRWREEKIRKILWNMNSRCTKVRCYPRVYEINSGAESTSFQERPMDLRLGQTWIYQKLRKPTREHSSKRSNGLRKQLHVSKSTSDSLIS